MKPGDRDGVERPEFEAVLEQSIEEGLHYVLGESGVKMVLTTHSLAELSENHLRLHEALSDIFMENGATLIEREIAKRLLDKVGSARDGARRSNSSWLTAARSSASAEGRATARERKVLREFMALALLPRDHQASAEPDATHGRIQARSIELTSVRFASAFKKGS